MFTAAPDPATLADLMARSALGDQTAFARLYQLTARKLFPVCLRILGRDAEAEEALQDAYVNIWKHASDYRPDKGSALVWMASVARHRALDLLRARREAEHLDDHPETAAPEGGAHDPLSGLRFGSEDAALRACLEALAEEQRRCVLLAYCEGYSHGELSERFGTPLGTIKSWVRRGLDALKACLGVSA